MNSYKDLFLFRNFEAEEKKEADLFVRRTVDRIDFSQGVFFTDGSFNFKNQRGAYAYICHQRLGGEFSDVFPLKAGDIYFLHDIAGAEMKALLTSLKVAKKSHFKQVVLFTDNLGAFLALKSMVETGEIGENSNELTRQFVADFLARVDDFAFEKIEVYRIPSHSGIALHDNVDKLIRNFTKKLKSIAEYKDVVVSQAMDKELKTNLLGRKQDDVVLLDFQQAFPVFMHVDKVSSRVRVEPFYNDHKKRGMGALEFRLIQLLTQLPHADRDVLLVHNSAQLKGDLHAHSLFSFLLKEHLPQKEISFEYVDKALGNLFTQFLAQSLSLDHDAFFEKEYKTQLAIQEEEQEEAREEEKEEEEVLYSTQDQASYEEVSLLVESHFQQTAQNLKEEMEQGFELAKQEERRLAAVSISTFIREEQPWFQSYYQLWSDSQIHSHAQALDLESHYREDAFISAIEQVLILLESEELSDLVLYINNPKFIYKLLENEEVNRVFMEVQTLARRYQVNLTVKGGFYPFVIREEE